MYAAYFATAVLILSAMGFNPMPFLAGAGILGLVVGFGAQSMINDVVSGFFILFENIYLVGDVIEVGTASGVVEAIEFRTTKIRDADGRLHIVRNGDMKLVVNYSKDYAVAAVALDVGYDADLRAVFASLHDAGEQLRAENRGNPRRDRDRRHHRVRTIDDDDTDVDAGEAGLPPDHGREAAPRVQGDLRSEERRHASQGVDSRELGSGGTHLLHDSRRGADRADVPIIS